MLDRCLLSTVWGKGSAVWMKMGLINNEKFRQLQTCGSCFQSLSFPEQGGGWGMGGNIRNSSHWLSDFLLAPKNQPLLDDGKQTLSLQTFTLALSNQFLLRLGPATPLITNCKQAALRRVCSGQHHRAIPSPTEENWVTVPFLQKSINRSQSKTADLWASSGDASSVFFSATI